MAKKKIKGTQGTQGSSKNINENIGTQGSDYYAHQKSIFMGYSGNTGPVGNQGIKKSIDVKVFDGTQGTQGYIGTQVYGIASDNMVKEKFNWKLWIFFGAVILFILWQLISLFF